jgi:hypothetical protein
MKLRRVSGSLLARAKRMTFTRSGIVIARVAAPSRWLDRYLLPLVLNLLLRAKNQTRPRFIAATISRSVSRFVARRLGRVPDVQGHRSVWFAVGVDVASL